MEISVNEVMIICLDEEMIIRQNAAVTGERNWLTFGTETAKDEAECPAVINETLWTDIQSYYKRMRTKIKRSEQRKSRYTWNKEVMAVIIVVSHDAEITKEGFSI